jgi:tetratricopeptide (TPR) repeat protein
MERWDESKAYLTKAYEHYRALPDNEWNLLMLSLNLAELEVAQNHIDQADEWARKAETLIKQFKDDERVETLELLNGQICLAKTEHLAAIEHFNRSLEIAKNLKRPDSIADSHYWLAQAELAIKDKKKARKNLLKAQTIYDNMGIQERVQEIQKVLESL